MNIHTHPPAMTRAPLGPPFDIVTSILVIDSTHRIGLHHDDDDGLERAVGRMINLINYPFYLGRRSKNCHPVSVHWYCLLWWQTALPPQTFHCHLIITVGTIIIASGWNSSDKDGQEFLERGWGWYRGLSKLHTTLGTDWWGCVCTWMLIICSRLYWFLPYLVERRI